MKQVLIFGYKKEFTNELLSFLFQKGYKISLAVNSKEKVSRAFSLPISLVDRELTVEQIKKFHCVINLSNSELSIPSSTYLINVKSLAEDTISKKNVTDIFLPFILTRSSHFLNILKLFYRFFLGFSFLDSKKEIAWIYEDDLYELIVDLIENEKKQSAVNAIANYVSYKEFFELVSLYTNRRSFLKLPSSFLSSFLNRSNRDFLRHSSVRVEPLKNLRFPHISLALKEVFCYLKTPTIAKESFHYVFRKEQFIPCSVGEVFDFFSDAKNLERITPPKLKFKILTESSNVIGEGTEFTYRLQLNGVPFYWKTIISGWNMPETFTDYQAKGPYQVWFHTHQFFPCHGGVLMKDIVLYRLPLSFLGDFFGLCFVKRNISKIFTYRFETVKLLFRRDGNE